jgi:SAM-dependent methyltransferase
MLFTGGYLALQCSQVPIFRTGRSEKYCSHVGILLVPMQNQKQLVQTLFDQSDYWQGRVYQEPDHHFAQKIARRKAYAFQMINRLPTAHNGTALDIGCGAGYYLTDLVKLGFDVHGVDNSPEMLKRCQELLERNGRASTVHLSLGDLENIPFDNSTFDLVLCVGVLDYLLTDETALTELWRIMKPGAHLLISISNQWNLSDLGYIIRRKLVALFRQSNATHPFVSQPLSTPTATWVMQHQSSEYQLRQYNLRHFERMMSGCQFQKVDAMTFGFQFRRLRKLRLIPESALISLEVFLENLLWRFHIPLLSNLGETYTAVFTKTI